MLNPDKGETPLANGEMITWTREDGSKDEVSLIRHRAAAVTYRVRTLQERPDGTGTVTTHSVPGGRLGTWLAELQARRDDEAEEILSVEVVMGCPKCNTENPPTATSCVECGSELETHTTSVIPIQQWLPESVPPVLRKAGLGYCFLGCGMLLAILVGIYFLTRWLGTPIGDIGRNLFGWP